MNNILCFGDSNTYGYIPDGSGRFDEKTRWTGIIQTLLGREYNIVEEGLCGRTTIFEDEYRPGRKGIDSISVAVESHSPLNLLILMLGTNDCKVSYGATPQRIGQGIIDIITKARKYAPKDMKILLVSPIHLGRGVGEEGYDTEFDSSSEKVCIELSKEYQKIAKEYDCEFLDAARFVGASSVDREHLDQRSHKILAKVMATKVLTILKKMDLMELAG